MLLDWRKVNRLLVACGFEQSVAASQLEPVLQALGESLQAHITFLTTEAAGYAVREESSASKRSGQVFLTQVADRHFTFAEVIDQLRQQAFDAAIIFTLPFQSCYTLAYLCYLCGIPIRLGQSLEFGGALLSQWIRPPVDAISPVDYHLHLLESINHFKERSLLDLS